MITNSDLKQTLHDLRFKRLTNYGNIAYKRASGDWRFEHVPNRLRELWYGPFLTLDIPRSYINIMSEVELIEMIDKERSLIASLNEIFLEIETQKAGTKNVQD